MRLREILLYAWVGASSALTLYCLIEKLAQM